LPALVGGALLDPALRMPVNYSGNRKRQADEARGCDR
jgi:hypothetical protein